MKLSSSLAIDTLGKPQISGIRFLRFGITARSNHNYLSAEVKNKRVIPWVLI